MKMEGVPVPKPFIITSICVDHKKPPLIYCIINSVVIEKDNGMWYYFDENIK